MTPSFQYYIDGITINPQMIKKCYFGIFSAFINLITHFCNNIECYINTLSYLDRTLTIKKIPYSYQTGFQQIQSRVQTAESWAKKFAEK